MALRVQSVYALWFLCSDFVYCILFPQLVTALFDRRANAIGSLAGFVVSLLRLGGGEPVLGLPTWIPYPMVDAEGIVNFPFRTTSMLAGLITIIIVSRLTRLSPLRALEYSRTMITLDRQNSFINGRSHPSSRRMPADVLPGNEPEDLRLRAGPRTEFDFAVESAALNVIGEP